MAVVVLNHQEKLKRKGAFQRPLHEPEKEVSPAEKMRETSKQGLVTPYKPAGGMCWEVLWKQNPKGRRRQSDVPIAAGIVYTPRLALSSSFHRLIHGQQILTSAGVSGTSRKPLLASADPGVHRKNGEKCSPQSSHCEKQRWDLLTVAASK